MKSRTCETYCAEGVFQIKYSICAFNFSNIYQGEAEHDMTFETS